MVLKKPKTNKKRMKKTNSSIVSRLILANIIIIFKMQTELCIDLKMELKKTFQSYMQWMKALESTWL